MVNLLFPSGIEFVQIPQDGLAVKALQSNCGFELWSEHAHISEVSCLKFEDKYLKQL